MLNDSYLSPTPFSISRPLLLSSVGRLVEHSCQKKLIITSTHGDITKLKKAYARLIAFFNELKAVAPQLSFTQCWKRILAKAMEEFEVKRAKGNPEVHPLPG